MGVVRADPFIAVGARHPVLVVRLDAVDVAVLTGTDLQDQYAGRLQAGLAVTVRQLEQAEADGSRASGACFPPAATLLTSRRQGQLRG